MAISVPVDIDLQIKKAIEDTNELVGGINKSLSGVEKQAKATGIAVSGIAFIELARAAIDFGKTIASVFEKAIDEAINSGLVTKGPHIGEVSGFKTAAGWVMNDREGIILNYE